MNYVAALLSPYACKKKGLTYSYCLFYHKHNHRRLYLFQNLGACYSFYYLSCESQERWKLAGSNFWICSKNPSSFYK